MKKINTILLLVFYLSVTTCNIFSQTNIKREHISNDLGISGDLVYCIKQDSKGFIWFGTMFGLVRYDGNDYKIYRYDPLDSNSLSNDDVISIFEDKNNDLWIGTYNGGLNKFDRHSGKFKRFLSEESNPYSLSSNTVWAIFQDSENSVWAGTENGLNKLIESTGKFKNYKKDSTGKGSISGNDIRCITEDKNGNLWIGTAGDGLNKYDSKTENFEVYKRDSLNKNSLLGNFVTSLVTDNDGFLWIGTARGLNKFDEIKNEFISFQRDSADQHSLSNDLVYSIKNDGNDHLLIGTQNGLNKFEKSTGKFEKLIIYPDSKKQESILTFEKDRSGVIWISEYKKGLIKLYEQKENFRNFLPGNDVKSIYETESGIFYIGTTNGLEVIDETGKNIKTYLPEKNNQNSLSSNMVNSVTGDNEGNLWIGTNNGLNKFNIEKKEFTRYYNVPGDSGAICSNNVLKLLYDKSGILWVGTDNGLSRLDPGSERFVSYRNDVNDKYSLAENTILSLYEDKYNTIWIGTYKGLEKMNKDSGKFTHFSKDPGNSKTISNNYIFSFCEDRYGNFWIGTGGGLNVFDRNSETFFHFAEKEGLPNSVIAGIEEDNNGFLWLSTFKGISKFDIQNRSFKNYDSDDGLQSNMFNTGSYFKSAKGEILFGGINGYSKFDPDKVIQNNFNSEAILTSLTKYEGKKFTEKDISNENDIDLNYKEDVIKIKFTSTDFSNPAKILYSYKLEGFDKDWTIPGNVKEAVYTNLDPGNYVFKVKTTNSDGVWNEKETSLKIFISPPFWRTWWFYSIVALTLIGLTILIYNYRVNNKIRKLIELEKIKERERELMREQASRDYHDELGHKLTRISLYSRRINKKLRPTANGLTNDLNSIVETSNSLQSGAKDLIWAMNPQEDSLYDFAVRLKDFGNELFENTGITFNFDGISESFRNVTLSMNSKRHLIYIFKEGMNNILKYANCTKVNLTFDLYDNDLEILLEDNGVGFDINNCAKGYGLKNIFSRSKQININVNISSDEKTGTKIRLKASISNLVSA
ncbi:MAG TPA: two-component regulator propeller domain-containing protein [Ignavibacteria bacterium]|nr:two-component regulator propeller domain-containing protein [Ignavibacteria bacterium]